MGGIFEIGDGGPAFPGNEEALLRNMLGITVRDYFAAKAMAAFIRNQANAIRWIGDEKIAEYAFELADAMLAEREKP